LAFPAAHRGVTSVIIGPRTLEQLESALDAATIALDDEVLDRIDEIVAPGTDVYSGGTWASPALSDSSYRRRPLEGRAAA
jgi:Aldo/keto reductase family